MNDIRFDQQEVPIAMALLRYAIVDSVCIAYLIKAGNGAYITRVRVVQKGKTSILADSPLVHAPFKQCAREFYLWVDTLMGAGGVPTSKKIINFPEGCDLETFVRTLVGSGEFTIKEVKDGHRKTAEGRTMGADSGSPSGV